MTVDLASLPAPEVIETLAFEAIVAALKADYIERYPAGAEAIDLESEPVVKLLESFAYRELIIRARYNAEARALLLAFATATDLDHIGITYYNGTQRLTVVPADLAAIPPVAAILETDDEYRQRLALQPEGESVAGPRDAYRYHALSASGQVKDAQPTRPQAGTVEVFVLARTGTGLPDAALLTTVATAVSAESVRPMCDEVIVSPAEIVDYALDIDLTLFSGPAGEVVLSAVDAALTKFSDTSYMLGIDIIRSAIDAAAHQPGVKKVTINSPAGDITCALSQAPRCTGITVRVTAVE